MIDALKKMNRKLLSLIIIIILIPILIIIFMALIQGCSNRKISHDAYEKKMVTAAQKYFTDKKSLPKFGDSAKVSIDTLVSGEYIKSPADYIGDDTCIGTVTVRNNGTSKDNYNYSPKLECKDYKKEGISDLLLKQKVSSGSGLYLVGTDYIFKGDEVKNYIIFYGKQYRIMGIENGFVKLLTVDSEDNSRIWDNKYNKDAGYSYGKNIYADSAIKKYLNKDYESDKKVSADAKKHLIVHNACIGKRKIGDNEISKNKDCNETLKGQLMTLPTVSDYALASTDPDCKTLEDKSCRNYNYLKDVLYSCWTSNAVSDNTYEVYYINNGLIEYQNANEYNQYNYIIYIDGSERVQSGNGSLEKPFVIE